MCEVESVARNYLQEFPLYDPTHSVTVRPLNNGKYWIGYRTTEYFDPHGSTHFDVNVEGEIFYLLFIEVEPAERKKGHGSILYDVLEQIAAALGCTMLEMTPSGTTPRGESRAAYLERRGYTLHGVVARKNLLA